MSLHCLVLLTFFHLEQSALDHVTQFETSLWESSLWPVTCLRVNSDERKRGRRMAAILVLFLWHFSLSSKLETFFQQHLTDNDPV